MSGMASIACKPYLLGKDGCVPGQSWPHASWGGTLDLFQSLPNTLCFGGPQKGIKSHDWPRTLLWHGHYDMGLLRASLVSQGREGPEGGAQQTQAPSDQSVHHSWIIGAAVVNAFYSPNRNQIGMPIPSYSQIPLAPECSPQPPSMGTPAHPQKGGTPTCYFGELYFCDLEPVRRDAGQTAESFLTVIGKSWMGVLGLALLSQPLILSFLIYTSGRSPNLHLPGYGIR